MQPPIPICTNFPRFPATWTAATGETGTAEVVRTFPELLAGLPRAALVLINGDADLTLQLCRHFWLHPSQRKPLVSADIVLRRPETWKQRAAALVKKTLLTRVDHFINYFHGSEGYARYYGIRAGNSSFVHFKPNLRYRYEPSKFREGEYVLCFGRSQRDYDTFFAAMEKLPYPAAVPKPNYREFEIHCSRFTRRPEDLPKNVTLLDDDGSQDSMIRILEGAKVVALPILASSMNASGIGVYLNAMLLRKCVVISRTPGAADVLTSQALFVPPEDAGALAEGIRKAWTDVALRESTAEAGHRHALSLGGEPELRQRTLDAAIAWYASRGLR